MIGGHHVRVVCDDDRHRVDLLRRFALLVDSDLAAPKDALGSLNDLGSHLAFFPPDEHLVHAIVEQKVLLGPVHTSIERHSMCNSLGNICLASGGRAVKPDGVAFTKLALGPA